MCRRKSVKPSRLRQIRGSMTLLLILGVILFTILTLLLLQLQSTFIAYERLASRAECISLEEAQALNSANYTGQINEAIVDSRECVFEDRSALQKVSMQRPDLLPLATQLLNESRGGASLLETNRQMLSTFVVESARQVLERETCALENSLTFSPLFVSAPKAHVEVYLGSLTGLDSNVFARTENQALATFDSQQNLINKASSHYRGNCNLSLPSPDNDLQFRVSSLPDRVLKEPTKQARLVRNELFESMQKVDLKRTQTLNQLPSASQVAVWFDGAANKLPSPAPCLRYQSASVCMGDLADFQADLGQNQ